MKVLLLGGSGQLGAEWKKFLKQQHFPIEYIAPASSEVDITNKQQLRDAFQKHDFDVIINCAAYTKVDQAEDEHDKAGEVNVKAVASLAELCMEHDTKLVHYSTDYVFPGRIEDKQKLPSGYPESYPADPVNTYGQTKWEGEEAIRLSGCRHLIIRVSWLCGQYGSNFVKTMLRLADKKPLLDIVSDQWGSPTFTQNTVENSLALVEDEAEGTYHLTSNGLITWADFAEEIFRLSGSQVKVNRIASDEFPTKARRPYFSKLDTKKISHVSGIELKDWKVGLKRLINELQ